MVVLRGAALGKVEMSLSPFSADSSVVILNAPQLTDEGDKDTFFTKRTGTTSSGKERKPRYTIEVRSQPLLMDFDEMLLGEKPAEALKGVIQDQINAITEKASAATLARRARSAGEFRAGLPSATKRYSGGRMGPMAPNQRDTLFNDSGRMREGIFVRQNPTDKTFTINLPANRDFAQDVAMFEKFRALVPALDPAKAAQLPAVKAAIEGAIGGMIQKAENETAAKLKLLAQARKRALLAAGRALLGVV